MARACDGSLDSATIFRRISFGNRYDSIVVVLEDCRATWGKAIPTMMKGPAPNEYLGRGSCWMFGKLAPFGVHSGHRTGGGQPTVILTPTAGLAGDAKRAVPKNPNSPDGSSAEAPD